MQPLKLILLIPTPCLSPWTLGHVPWVSAIEWYRCFTYTNYLLSCSLSWMVTLLVVLVTSLVKVDEASSRA